MEDLNRKTVEEFRKAEKNPVTVVLDNIRSMHNVGSIFRTADAFLIESVCLCGYTPQPPHRDINKTALGATETVSWTYYPTALEAVKRLKTAGYLICAVEQAEGSILLNRLDSDYFAEAEKFLKIAVIFGNEVSGVDNQILELCNYCIEIPQAGMKHSLNVSVAAGIVLWEIVKLINLKADH